MTTAQLPRYGRSAASMMPPSVDGPPERMRLTISCIAAQLWPDSPYDGHDRCAYPGADSPPFGWLPVACECECHSQGAPQ
jgi:hypothetical protein